MGSRNGQITVALIGAAGAIAAAWIASSHTGNGSGGSGGGPGGGTTPSIPSISIPSDVSAEVFLNRDSGPGGTTVLVSGKGFEGGERVVLRFHTDQVGAPTASANGSFAQVAVTIPTSYSQFAPQQFFIVATGDSSAKSAQAPFEITG